MEFPDLPSMAILPLPNHLGIAAPGRPVDHAQAGRVASIDLEGQRTIVAGFKAAIQAAVHFGRTRRGRLPTLSGRYHPRRSVNGSEYGA